MAQEFWSEGLKYDWERVMGIRHTNGEIKEGMDEAGRARAVAESAARYARAAQESRAVQMASVVRSNDMGDLAPAEPVSTNIRTFPVGRLVVARREAIG